MLSLKLKTVRRTRVALLFSKGTLGKKAAARPPRMRIRVAVLLVLASRAAVPEPPPPQVASPPVVPGTPAPQEYSRIPASIARVSRLLDAPDPEWLPPVTPPHLVSDTQDNAETALRAMEVSASPAVRARALEALKETAAVGAADRFQVALTDPDPAVRGLAFQELGKNHPAQLYEYVITALAGGAIEAVAAVNLALPNLRSVLETPMMNTLADAAALPLHRRSAAYALGKMGSQAAGPALAEGVWATDPDMAFTCAQALSSLRDAQPADAWMRMLEHPQPAVRGMAVDALAGIGGAAAHDAIVSILSGARPVEVALQVYTVRAIKGWPGEVLYPLLVDTMRRNPPLSAVAAEVLQTRTGQRIGPDPEQWQQWLDSPPPEPAPVPPPGMPAGPQDGMMPTPQPKAAPIYHEPVVHKRRR
jgi:hypothetical protein